MVNLSKRMHKLMPLWKVKSGVGAAILPPKPPAPQLKHLHLRLPNPCNGYDDGARQFWKSFLPGLRYHNLTLPIVVEQTLKPGPSFVPSLTLQFESQDKDQLEKLDIFPALEDEEALQTAKDALAAREQQERIAEIETSVVRKNRDRTTWVDVLRKEQEVAGIPEGSRTHIGEVHAVSQPPANPSAPSSTSPPVTMYSRTVTLALRGRRSVDIWDYFKTVTQARQYLRNREDRTGARKYARFFKRAEEDRQRLKASIDAVRKEKAELKRAREAAERLSSEA